MADLAYRNENLMPTGSRADWGAVWFGVFTFFAIFSVFGFLGIALLARSSNPVVGNSLGGMTLGMDIWAVVLTVIAMYVAGFETGRSAAVASRHDGMIHGMVVFGVTTMAVLLLVIVAGNYMSSFSFAAETHAHTLSDLLVNLGWTGFLSLFLGWLAALGGASAAVRRLKQPERAAQPIRTAA